ncbi:MAG: GxxExxY protein [Planctomycetes bacterium]|nr:GxxExxY protein [Planctomycetota bacterium]MCK5565727.1 GxxExxY protein [Planctomycetota bacterium]
MSTNKDKIIFKDLSYKIVGLAMEVHNELGYGFLEKVYENALMLLFTESGIKAEQQVAIPVCFRGNVIGEYFADILVEDKIILELKASSGFVDCHRAQVLNYLKATNKPLGLLINFGKTSLEHERLVN